LWFSGLFLPLIAFDPALTDSKHLFQQVQNFGVDRAAIIQGGLRDLLMDGSGKADCRYHLPHCGWFCFPVTHF